MDSLANASSSSSESARAGYSEYTDLDALLAHIDNTPESGDDYEALQLLSQFIGPANTKPRAVVDVALLQEGTIELRRRRVLADGRVKLKLVLLGSAVDKCGICLSQFKADQPACRIHICSHVFHQSCLNRWLENQGSCPICRKSLLVTQGP